MLAILAVVLVGAVIYVRAQRNHLAKSTTTTTQTKTTTSSGSATTTASKDPALDQAATDASSSVSELNSSYSTDTSNSNLTVTQGALQ